MEMEEIKPSAKWYMFSVAAMAAGVCAVVYSVFALLGVLNAPKQYITPPDRSSVVTDTAGSWDIYYEYRHAYQLRQDIRFTFTNTETGEAFDSHFPSYSSNYTMSGVNGVLVAVVDLAPGAYTVTSSFEPDGTSPAFAFAKGGMALSIMGKIFLMVGGLLAAVAGIAATITIFILRGKRKKQRDQWGYGRL